VSQIQFFTDEDVHRALAVQLRSAGVDAVSTPEAGRLSELDSSQLLWAAQEGRVLLTFNVSDFARLHHEWMNRGLHHAGLIVSRQRSVGDTLRRVLHVAQSLTAEQMHDRLEYLSNW
jgi:hypothetical protein